jgi:predicted  nucleic acid-binding Zn-ribbon protein
MQVKELMDENERSRAQCSGLANTLRHLSHIHDIDLPLLPGDSPVLQADAQQHVACTQELPHNHNEALQHRVALLEAELDACQAELQAVRVSMSEMEKTAARALAEQVGEVALAHARLTAQQSSLEQARKAAHLSEADAGVLDLARAELAALEEHCSGQEAELVSLRGATHEHEDALHAATQRSVDEAARLKAALADARQSDQAAGVEVARLQRELTRAEAACAATTQEAQSLRGEVAAVQADLDEAQRALVAAADTVQLRAAAAGVHDSGLRSHLIVALGCLPGATDAEVIEQLHVRLERGSREEGGSIVEHVAQEEVASLRRDVEALREQRDAYEKQAQEAEWHLGDVEFKLDEAFTEAALLRQAASHQDRRCASAPATLCSLFYTRSCPPPPSCCARIMCIHLECAGSPTCKPPFSGSSVFQLRFRRHPPSRRRRICMLSPPRPRMAATTSVLCWRHNSRSAANTSNLWKSSSRCSRRRWRELGSLSLQHPTTGSGAPSASAMRTLPRSRCAVAASHRRLSTLPSAHQQHEMLPLYHRHTRLPAPAPCLSSHEALLHFTPCQLGSSCHECGELCRSWKMWTQGPQRSRASFCSTLSHPLQAWGP